MKKAEENNLNKSEAALREEKVLEFWRENKIFEKSLEKKSPKGHYVFYDGPPFATGQIHYGHILGSTAKDVIGRYQTMQGFFVPRKWGWDCHGLPIENIVEKDLGIAGHKEIEKFGIDKFVEHARSKVLQYDKDWERGIERIGRWVDFRGGYKTMDNLFIESVWWALGELNKKNLIYEGVRVLAYCARCETPIANSEIAMDNSYKDISDISVYVKFELENEPGTYLLAWTTTPWTLPGNTAIAINKDIIYVKVKVGNDILILAKDTLESVVKDKEYSMLGEISAEDIVGKKYKPVFPYYQNIEMLNKENIWKVWSADFVTTEMGTGIAHEAPAFGEDDMDLAKANNIPWILHIDETGRFKDEITDFRGMQVKPKGDEKDAHQKADVEIIKYLAKNNILFAKEKIIHSYPHCMRCDTPIIYYALPSWFINIAKVKKDIKKQAKNMNWIPGHLKEGRFKNIVENAPDWNISRNRYWASPLPIWKCQECKKQIFVNSLEELKKKTKKSGNKYFIMRHGGSIGNMKNVNSLNPGDKNDALTENGLEQVRLKAESFKEKLDIIISSNFTRTRQTAEIVAKTFRIAKEEILINEELREVRAVKSPAESYKDIRKRMVGIMQDLEKKYSGKNILIISHEYPLRVLLSSHEALSEKEESENLNVKYPIIKNGEISICNFLSLPRNNEEEIDLHRPYIDKILLVCACGGELERIPEVLDCWFESGSMPFAQDHYPFENKNWKNNNFPAGFVAEYIAQTRTWFYYTHVVSTILFNKAPFKNIVTTGTLRATDGEKMSKSKNNYPDPWNFIDKYGVDALRIYLMSSPLMKGEDANFSEKAVQEIASKIIGRLFNVLAFYELYPAPEQARYEAGRDVPSSKNVLDQWILLRLNQVLNDITKGMEAYDMTEAARPLDLFIEDLSTWYLRRSRERIKSASAESSSETKDGDNAKITLYFILKTLAKIMAPFAPFTAEDIWLRLKNIDDVESVHLAEWPAPATPKLRRASKVSVGAVKIIKDMQTARDICAAGNAERQKLNIPVRQPLNKLRIKNYELKIEYIELIKDELNIKELVQDKNIENEIELDENITPVLKAEGEYREFMRELQDKRKKLGLNPSDKMAMSISDVYKKYKIPIALQDHMFRVAAVASLICDNFNEPLPKEEIITACLLHDMGNIIKSDLNYFPDFLQPQGLEYWQKIKEEYIKKYGLDENIATEMIAREINISEQVIIFLKNIGFSNSTRNELGELFEHKICNYADMRVGPYGVISMEERILEAQKRYMGKKHSIVSDGVNTLTQSLRNIEKQIFAKCKIKPEDINDESVKDIISSLRGFMIK